MSLRLRLLPEHLPEVLRRAAIRTLFRATLDAFGEPMPDVRGWSSARLLDAYAARSDELTRDVLSDAQRQRRVAARLSENTERLGGSIRRALAIRTEADAFETARRLYSVIGIELRRTEPERVVAARCSFASRYSPDVCSVMAAADAGLFAGLTGGARLTFVERITSGAPACVATLTREVDR